MPTPSYLSHIGIGLETTIGTYVVPTLFIPFTKVTPEDVIETVLDMSIDANSTDIRGAYQGAKDSTLNLDFYWYPEVVGIHLAALGMVDTITGTNPYTHTMKLAAAGTQPKTYSLTLYNGFEARGFPGMMLDQLKLTVGSAGVITATADWKGWPSATQSTPTPSFPTLPPFLAWQNQITIAGSASTRLLSGDMTFKRNADTIHTLAATQSPKTTFADVIGATGTAKLLYEDNTDYTNFLTNVQPAINWDMTQPGGGSNPHLTMKFGKTTWTKDTIDLSGKYAVLDTTWSGIYNATDQASASAVLVDAHTPAYA